MLPMSRINKDAAYQNYTQENAEYASEQPVPDSTFHSSINIY